MPEVRTSACDDLQLEVFLLLYTSHDQCEFVLLLLYY